MQTLDNNKPTCQQNQREEDVIEVHEKEVVERIDLCRYPCPQVGVIENYVAKDSIGDDDEDLDDDGEGNEGNRLLAFGI